jgi:hypothetical protein
MAVFPLWSREDGFGVISIFRGPARELYVENDQVPLGATVYFANKPDLRIEEYFLGGGQKENKSTRRTTKGRQTKRAVNPRRVRNSSGFACWDEFCGGRIR